jgi:hypothetical protein
MNQEFEEQLRKSKEAKKIIDFLKKEADGKHTEFRIVVYTNNTCLAHVMDRNSDTITFELP